MPDIPAVPQRPRTVERLRRQFDDAAQGLGLTGPDAGLELAGRFGLRRFFERHDTNDPEFQQGPWLLRAREMRKEARELSRVMAAQGLRHFFFKGIALVGRFYRIEERRLDDIDLYLEPATRNSVLATLHARGYAEHGDTESDGAGRPGMTMTRGSDVLLDVHWGLEAIDRAGATEPVGVPPAVWSGLEVQGGLPVPHDEHHAALVLHHWARHDLDHVRGMLDFVFLWDALPHASGAELSEVARHLGVTRLLGAAGRALVDDLALYPLRGVRLAGAGWREQGLVRRLRVRQRLMDAARNAAPGARHMAVTRRRAWLRFVLADRAHPLTLLRDLAARQ